MVICREGRRERKRYARRNRQFERDDDEREEKRERGRETKRLHDFTREKKFHVNRSQIYCTVFEGLTYENKLLHIGP